MNLKTTLGLLVVLAVLLGAYFLLPKDEKASFRESGKMVSGYEPDKVTRIRIDNAERNEKVVLAKSGEDWQMEEPLRVPADAVPAKFIADFFANYDGTKVGKEGDAAARAESLGLANPRATVELEIAAAGEKGAPRKVVCAIGADNVKGDKVFLRIDKTIYEAPRTIYNSIAKNSGEFRDRRVFTIGQWEIDQIERTTKGVSTILKLEDGVWRLLAPFQGRADAALSAKWAGLAGLRVDRFENDAPSDLAKYGLDAPETTLTLRSKQKSQTLRLGKSGDDRVFVQREGSGQIWGIADGDLAVLRKTAEEMRDASIFGTFSHENVKLLHWRSGDLEIEISQDPVTRKARLAKPRDADVDRDALEAILKTLDGLKANDLPSAVGANLAELGLAPPVGFLELQLKDAPRATRVELGAARAEGAFAKREGDDYLLRVPAGTFAFTTKPATDLVSKELVHIDSYDPGQLELDFARPGEPSEKKKLVFKRNETNKWVAGAGGEESKAFADLTEALWHAKATEVLAADPKETPLANPAIEIRVYRRLFNDPKGDEKEKERIATYRFAKDPAGEAWFGSGITGSSPTGGFAMKVPGDLPAKLLGLAFPAAPGPAASQPASQPASAPAGPTESKPEKK